MKRVIGQLTRMNIGRDSKRGSETAPGRAMQIREALRVASSLILTCPESWGQVKYWYSAKEKCELEDGRSWQGNYALWYFKLSDRHPHLYNLHMSEPHLHRRMQLLVVSISVVALVTIRFDSWKVWWIEELNCRERFAYQLHSLAKPLIFPPSDLE